MKKPTLDELLDRMEMHLDVLEGTLIGLRKTQHEINEARLREDEVSLPKPV